MSDEVDAGAEPDLGRPCVMAHPAFERVAARFRAALDREDDAALEAAHAALAGLVRDLHESAQPMNPKDQRNKRRGVA